MCYYQGGLSKFQSHYIIVDLPTARWNLIMLSGNLGRNTPDIESQDDCIDMDEKL